MIKVKKRKILLLPGDGIGPEIITEALKVLDLVNERLSLQLSICYGALGGDAIDRFGVPFPEETKQSALNADAILFGSVGGRKWDALPRDIRPEKGLLAIRSALGLFANLFFCSPIFTEQPRIFPIDSASSFIVKRSLPPILYILCLPLAAIFKIPSTQSST